MAASTAYGTTHFTTDGTPKTVYTPPSGSQFRSAIETVPTTSIDEAGDFFAFVPVPEGRRLTRLEWIVAAIDSHATPTSDVDIVLRVTDKDGSNTDTILHNAGAGFQDGETAFKHHSQLVSGTATGYGLVGFKTNTGGATEVEASHSIGVTWE
jgi:hypothetical protein